VAGDFVLPAASILVVNMPENGVNGGVFPFALDGIYMKASDVTPSSATLIMDLDFSGNFDADITILVSQMPDGSYTVACTDVEDHNHKYALLGPNGEMLIESFDTSATPQTFPGSSQLVFDDGPPTSYGVNARADKFKVSGDTNKILAVEYRQVVANVVGDSFPDNWVRLCAPRHNSVMNVLFRDGHVEDFSPDDISPLDPTLNVLYWQPEVIAN
jgi:prepilin-type processing-associated H-X9-DG protein